MRYEPGRFFFLSNPKCGSNSIRHLLNRHSKIRVNHATADGWYPHHRARKQKERVEAMGDDWSSLVSFTTIRNPWDRMVSCYVYGKNTPESRWRTLFNEVDGDFARFVAGAPKSMHVGAFAGDGKGGMLVRHIVPLERASELLPAIFAEIGVPFRRLPKLYAQRADNEYRSFYDEETRRHVAQLFATDIELAGYEF